MAEKYTLEQDVQTLADAFEVLGVTESTLSAQERRSIEDDGFVVLHDVIDADWLQNLRKTYEALMNEKYGPWHPDMNGGKETDFWNHEAGTRRLADLVSEGDVFDRIYTHPRLLATVACVLGGDFMLHSLNARDALPGQGHQALHVDGQPLKPGERPGVVNSAWLLDDFTVENGATRVVPGTHKLTGAVSAHVADPLAVHLQQRIVTAPAGSVIVFNSYLWHSGTQNRTRTARRVIHAAFSKPSLQQHDCQKLRIRKSTYERISPAARYLLRV
jgi:ectoine hydroxylase-related dioxygenase (phytanoyl-CoA dioxygenase family)